MKQSLKLAPLAGTLALALATSASADRPMSDFERDMALAFENDGEPMELALLSEKEMRETQGEFSPIAAVAGLFKNWTSRLVAGSAFGFIKSGADEQHNMYASPIQVWQAANIMYWGFAGVLSKHPAVAAGIAGVDEWFPNWGVRRIHTELLRIDENYPSLGDFARDVAGAIDDYSSSLYGGSGGGGTGSSVLSYTASQSSSSGVSGAALVQRLPQDALRNFFSGLPEGSMDVYLRGVGADTTRADFLANLPSETVNKLILLLSDDEMRDFVGILPSGIMTPVFNTSPATADYWRPHWRT